ncbi:MAG TPA: hypothetical protein VFU05_09390 [Cyclobacteriaceae bacterium]|nr:hypothetical protein [Cyclobacteriaceae bacterium]
MRVIAILMIFSFNAGFSQTFRGEASLPKVEVDGFYRVFLSPDLSTHLNAEFTNIRIYDQQNKEIPYLFQQDNPVKYTQVFKEYEIVEKKQVKNCCTSLVLHNAKETPINNISLSIKNAEVTKTATLLGSDDKENWFALKQRFTLSSIDNQDRTAEIKIVDFPLSNYSYYLIQLDDSTSAPLNILKAGYYEVNAEDGKYTQITSIKTGKSDDSTSKQSFVRVTFDSTRVVDKFSIEMSGAPYFLRRASLAIKKERLNKKKEKEVYYELLSYFELSSKQPSVLELPGIQVHEFLITIENDDNPPLEVATIKTYQLNRYLTAWLTKGQSYSVKLGEMELQAPVYDIGFFKDSIPDQPQVLSLGPVSIFEKKSEESPTYFTNRSIIWVAIVIVIIVLGFMTMRMVNETSEKE